MLLSLLLLACTANPALEARVAVLEAQHEADLARIAALEAQAARLDAILEIAEAATQSPATYGTTATDAAAVGTALCTQDGDTYVLPTRDELSPEALAKEARVVPHKSDKGEVDGFRVAAIRRGRLADSCGLRNGDLLFTVAGLPVTNPDQSLRAWQKSRDDKAFAMELERRGEPLSIRYRWPD